MRVAITGAGGFVGRALASRLGADGHEVVPILRRAGGMAGEVVLEDIARIDELRLVLARCDAVVHLAGRAHITAQAGPDAMRRFREVNVEGTRRVADAAAKAAVRRLVFVSSIGVNGDGTKPGSPFHADSPPDPGSAYAESKWEAEQALRDVARRTELEIVIVRPPLIYGRNAPGRFASLVNWVRRGLPLPLGLVRNRRNFVSIDNITDFLAQSLVHVRAAGEVFLVADAESVSTREFVALIAAKMGKRPLFIPVPPAALWVAARMLGREQAAQGLLGSLELSLEKNDRLLGWTPPLTLEQGLEKAVRRD